ncbi:trypsin [Mycobacterium sp. E342]|uniref:trypsin-like peptidase domain-containing protein n=1 Tax=Mycobacterium sp. E342 TaxID=1834147 RepID=UPI0007FFF118|nr:trypsin-like peptidase domain-containing protein [Mycobacterium sp. E342]OBH22677.1 trypsin [Mycobacterium sp. E342]
MSRRASLVTKRRLPSRSLALLSAAALPLLGSPGIASADGGRPQTNPEERAAAMIRPAVMYFAAEAAGWVRLPNGNLLPHYSEPNANRAFDAAWGCTAFVVNPDGWVATAGHCVDPEGAKDAILRHAATDYIAEYPDSPEAADPEQAVQWLRANAHVEGTTADRGPEISITLLYGTGTKVAGKMPANVVDFKPLEKGDVALLKVEKHNLPSSELATDADVNIGTSVLAVGFPGSTERVTDPSLDPTNKSGKVSKKSTMGTIPEYEIDAAVSPGMSGGPTIELNGKVIGLNSFGPTGEPQAFNFIAPADGLAAVLAGKGVKATLGPADVSYRKGLDAYYTGHYTDAIKQFDQVLSMSPDYPGVADLKTNAVNLRAQYGDVSAPGTSKAWWYLLGGVALLLAVGGGVVLVALMSRRRRTAPAAVPGFQPVPGGQFPAGGPQAGPFAPQAAPPVAPAPAPGAPETPGAVQPGGLAVAQPSTAAEPHFCAGCGAEHHPAERFCPNCGKQISAG